MPSLWVRRHPADASDSRLGRLAQAERGLDSRVQAVASASAPTRHGHDCPCYGCTGWKPVPRRGVGETPTLRKPARILEQSLV
ncbi:MAG: hypothetical protein NZ874_09245 [Fimbriimonadales bacterium]|nr:hypothetical protein [Fimbriimonadales bacterium]